MLREQQSSVPKYFGKKLPSFDKSLMTLEFLHQFYHSKEFIYVQSLEATMFGKLIGRHPWLSQF